MAITEENSESNQQPIAEDVKITIHNQVQSMQKKFSQYNVQDQKPIVGYNYRVPNDLREENEDMYTPKVVSIGSMHHGKPQLKEVEQSKWIFLGWYFKRPSALSFDEMVRAAIDIEEEARMSYLECFHNISSQEFSEMIILDFIFLIEFFLKNDNDDMPFHTSIYLDVLSDLMLLENQLPQRLVTNLYDKFYKENVNLGKLILDHFNNYDIAKFPEVYLNNWNRATDMLDFMVKCNGDKIKKTEETWLGRTRSAIELREAGVKFSMMEEANFLLDVNFVNIGNANIKIGLHDRNSFSKYDSMRTNQA